jgi:hypothetical protein
MLPVTQPAVVRTNPTAEQLAKIATDALIATASSGAAFTLHHVTQKARQDNPTVELSHETIKAIVAPILSGSSDYAVVYGAQVGGAEARLYVRTLPH